ncbi:adenylate kinase [Clostridia bacterium]|nr:adenylate kinase [Clostridia bacterium]
MKLILLGPPGSGKGTQAAVLTEKLGVPIVSTGNILRAEVAAKSDVGLKAKSFMDAGELVPDEVIMEIVRRRFEQPDAQKGFILDGFPRTVPQAEALDKITKLDLVLLLDVPDDEIVRRMSGRRVCGSCGDSYHVLWHKPKADGVCDKCGAGLIIRPDDAEETVLNRLKVYHDQTSPLLGYYRKTGLLKSVEIAERVEDTTANMLRVVNL